MTKRCSNCGHENRDVAIFCGNCGSRLIATNFTSNLRDTGSSTNSSTTYTNNGANANGSDAGSLCCAVLLILFIIMIIMSMG